MLNRLFRRDEARRDELAAAEARHDEAHAALRAALSALLAERNQTGHTKTENGHDR